MIAKQTIMTNDAKKGDKIKKINNKSVKVM